VGIILKANLKYLICFGLGLVVATVIPVRATPNVLHDMSGTILAQAQSGEFSEYSLRTLATCLDNSGFTVRQGKVVDSTSNNPSPNYRDGVVNNKQGTCLRIREEGTIQNVVRCIPNGEGVQVLLKQGKPIITTYNNLEYIFVISYSDGSKGWVSAGSINFQ
jgi:hypothetical protein